MSGQSAEILKPFGDYHTPGPDESVIDILTIALEKAKRGEAVSVAVVLISPTGKSYTQGFAGHRGYGELLGSIDVLHADVMDKWKDACG